MALQHIKKRLSGIRSINQMTEAMELVAATKMRKAQEAALSSRPYALTALEILANLAEYLASTEARPAAIDVTHVKLLQHRSERKTAILLIAADKGLAGSFNSAVFRRLEKYLATQNKPVENFIFIAVGQKAADYVKRKGWALEREFTRYGDMIDLPENTPLADLLVEGYMNERWDNVVAFSTHFFSAIHQEVLKRQLLPIRFDKIRSTVEELIPERGRYSDLRSRLIASRPTRPTEYIIEPSPEEALNALLPMLFKMQVYHLILEANASEHSARRMAMKNATDNAGNLIGDLVLLFNRSRQAEITKEIIEITSTTAAIKK
jgi:F-type H+-transporting ATPase subunit gamma